MLTTLKFNSEENGVTFFDAYCKNDDGTNFKTLINITSLDGDLAQARGIVGQTVERLATVISGCYHPESNASKIIKEAFGKDGDTGEISFNMDINGITVMANKAKCDYEKIVERWWNNYRLMRE